MCTLGEELCQLPCGPCNTRAFIYESEQAALDIVSVESSDNTTRITFQVCACGCLASRTIYLVGFNIRLYPQLKYTASVTFRVRALRTLVSLSGCCMSTFLLSHVAAPLQVSRVEPPNNKSSLCMII